MAGPPASWMEEASRRGDGLLFRLRERVERSAPRPALRDERGQIYRLDSTGITYSPFDDNWSPAVPSTAEAPLFLARARGLLENRAVEPAVEILLALRAMDLFQVPESARQAAAEASSIVHDLSVRRQDLASIVDRVDPFALYDASRNETWLVSEAATFRVALPGRFRLRRGQAYASPDERINRILHLTDGTHFVMISVDLWPGSPVRLRNEEYFEVMDFRRGFDRSRRESTEFTRRCEGELCTCSFIEKGRRKEWQEAVKTRSGAAFFFSVYPSNESLLRDILDRLVGGK